MSRCTNVRSWLLLAPALAALTVVPAAARAGHGHDDDSDDDSDSGSDDDSDSDDDSSGDPLNDGLVVYWPLDGDAEDRSPGGHLDGHLCGPTPTEGHSGPGSVALEFDGVDDYVDLVEAMPTVGGLGQGTISLWFRVDQTPDQTGNRPNPRAVPPFPGVPQVDQITFPALYLGATDPILGNNSLMVHPIHPNNKPTAWFTIVRDSLPADPVTGRVVTPPFFCFDSCWFPTNTTTCDGPGPDLLTAGQWYHFVIAVDATGNRGYLNGVELVNRRFNPDRSRFPLPQFPPGPGVPSEATDVEFFDDVLVQESFKLGAGVWGYAVNERFLDGAIDEVRIYDRVLTAAEVTALYQASDTGHVHPHAESCTGEEFWWKDAAYQQEQDADWRWDHGWGAWWDQSCVDEADQDEEWWDKRWW